MSCGFIGHGNGSEKMAFSSKSDSHVPFGMIRLSSGDSHQSLHVVDVVSMMPMSLSEIQHRLQEVSDADGFRDKAKFAFEILALVHSL
jgi:hypothetical protein